MLLHGLHGTLQGPLQRQQLAGRLSEHEPGDKLTQHAGSLILLMDSSKHEERQLRHKKTKDTFPHTRDNTALKATVRCVTLQLNGLNTSMLDTKVKESEDGIQYEQSEHSFFKSLKKEQ